MDEKERINNEQLDSVSGGAGAQTADPKKNLVRNLYDKASELDKELEDGIVKFEKDVADLFKPKGS